MASRNPVGAHRRSAAEPRPEVGPGIPPIRTLDRWPRTYAAPTVISMHPAIPAQPRTVWQAMTRPGFPAVGVALALGRLPGHRCRDRRSTLVAIVLLAVAGGALAVVLVGLPLLVAARPGRCCRWPASSGSGCGWSIRDRCRTRTGSPAEPGLRRLAGGAAAGAGDLAGTRVRAPVRGPAVARGRAGRSPSRWSFPAVHGGNSRADGHRWRRAGGEGSQAVDGHRLAGRLRRLAARAGAAGPAVPTRSASPPARGPG